MGHGTNILLKFLLLLIFQWHNVTFSKFCANKQWFMAYYLKVFTFKIRCQSLHLELAWRSARESALRWHITYLFLYANIVFCWACALAKSIHSQHNRVSQNCSDGLQRQTCLSLTHSLSLSFFLSHSCLLYTSRCV